MGKRRRLVGGLVDRDLLSGRDHHVYEVQAVASAPEPARSVADLNFGGFLVCYTLSDETYTLVGVAWPGSGELL